MSFLRLSSGCHLARADSPNGLVRDHNVFPVGWLESGYNGCQLVLAYASGFPGFPLSKGLANAKNHTKTDVEGSTGLLCNVLRSLVEERPAFGVAWRYLSGAFH